MRTRLLLPLLGSFLLIATAANAADGDAVAAQNSFDQGNAAFRIGNYAGALASYNDAMVNGKNSARLYYNMGLTHYRLGQYSQAKWVLSESSKDEGMAALSHYLLGIIAEKEGNSAAAAAWFERSRDGAESRRLRDLSRSALDNVGVPQPEFVSNISLGYGNDSNAFRAPNSSYNDLSQTIPTLVVPVEQSGAYIPVRINAAFSNPVSDTSNFVASYRHRGYYYSDSALSNADETDHRVTIGMVRDTGPEKSRNEQLSFDAVLRSHSESNFDRDDGLDRFDDGASIVDRYNYVGAGVEAELRNRIGRNRYVLEGGWSQRDYDEVPTASSYDLTTYWLGGAYKIPLADSSRLKIGYEFHVRSFDQRSSRDLTGDASTQNPTLEYQYHRFEVGVRHRFSEGFVTEFIYFYTIRNDQFVGYNDYTKGKFRLESTIDFSDRVAASVKIDFRDQDYENAFAFDDPTQPSKEYEEFQVAAQLSYQFTEQLSLRADIKQENIASSDPRGEYDRTRASLGVNWAF